MSQDRDFTSKLMEYLSIFIWLVLTSNCFSLSRLTQLD